jgi:hypothetical protein
MTCYPSVLEIALFLNHPMQEEGYIIWEVIVFVTERKEKPGIAF